MVDFLGHPLKVGDNVVMIAPNYRKLVKAVIIHETPQNFRVRFINNWNYISNPQETIQSPEQLVFVPE